MSDYTHYSWTYTGDDTTTDASNVEVWYGGTQEIGMCDPATTPWQELYHEEDYRGIMEQLMAEDLGYVI